MRCPAASASAASHRAADTAAPHPVVAAGQDQQGLSARLGALPEGESRQLPAAIDSAYADAEALLMEIDMDDLDPAQMQQVAMELACCRRTAAGAAARAADLPQFAAKAREMSASTRRMLEALPALVRRDDTGAAAADEDGSGSDLGRRAAPDAPRGRRPQADPGPGNIARTAGDAGRPA